MAHFTGGITHFMWVRGPDISIFSRAWNGNDVLQIICMDIFILNLKKNVHSIYAVRIFNLIRNHTCLKERVFVRITLYQNMHNFSNLLSVSDVSAAEALFVAAYRCTSDSHLSNSFIRVALLSLLGSLWETIFWQECLQTWDRRWLVVQPQLSLCCVSSGADHHSHFWYLLA